MVRSTFVPVDLSNKEDREFSLKIEFSNDAVNIDNISYHIKYVDPCYGCCLFEFSGDGLKVISVRKVLFLWIGGLR